MVDTFSYINFQHKSADHAEFEAFPSYAKRHR